MATDKYETVGKMHLKKTMPDGTVTESYCAATIAKPGVLVFAKHCLRDGFEVASIDFTTKRGKFSFNLTPPAMAGGAGSDIAYVKYDPAETNGAKGHEIDKDTPRLFPGDPAKLKNVRIEMVGYTEPKPGMPNSSQKIVSNCELTGEKSILGAKGSDSGYDGTLYNTTCKGSAGLEGGPVFAVDRSTGARVLLGVVSHSFDFEADGKTLKGNPEANQDMLGSCWQTTAFSPFAQADSEPLKKLLEPVSKP